MKYLDTHPSVLAYASEEIRIAYVSPVDNEFHTYYPDFFVRARTKDGKIKDMIWEVKPHKQSIEPTAQTKITKRYLNEVVTYGVNKAKWEAAVKYCAKRGWEFCVITEKELGFKV